MGAKSRLILVLAAVLCGCPNREVIRPTPVQPTDTSSCAAACKKLDDMHCEEGKPLEDGTSCTKFCEDTQHSGHALRPSCILEKVSRCQDIDKLCFEK
jgi:hypothetical protein